MILSKSHPCYVCLSCLGVYTICFVDVQMIQKVRFSAWATYPWSRQNNALLPWVNLMACCCQQQSFLFLLSLSLFLCPPTSGCAVSLVPPCQLHPDIARIWLKMLIQLKTIQFWLYNLVFHWCSLVNKFREELKKCKI